MPIWIIFLLIYLCLITVGGFYVFRPNGRHGKGNGHGHTISQTLQSSDTALAPTAPQQGKKLVIMSPTLAVVEEEHCQETTLQDFHKNNAEVPHEESHDYSEGHSPDPVMRERRRPLKHPREEEEEGEDDEWYHPKPSPAPETLPAPNKGMTLETGTQEEGPPEEEVIDILIVKKDVQTQTLVLQEDKGVEARPDRRDEEVQSSPVRENRTVQAMPSTREMGTGEWLTLQKSVGVGNHIETAEKGLGEPLKTKNRKIHVSPDQEDKFLQESPDHHSIGVGTDKREVRDQSLQIFPFLQDKDIQKDLSRVSVGIQNVNIFGEDKSIQAEEDISISLSSLPQINQSFFWDEEEFDFSKSLSLSLSRQPSQNFLDEIQTVTSEIFLSSQSNSLKREKSDIEEPVIQRHKIFLLEDIPLEVSRSLPLSSEESSLMESQSLEPSRSFSLQKSQSPKDKEDMSFELVGKSPKSVQKKPLNDLSFEIIEKASRKSSFVILKDED